jgi:hypothetical protein
MSMAGKVIHISDELHNKIREYCNKRDIPASQWARRVLENAIGNNSDVTFIPVPLTPLKPEDTAPVEKKKLPPPPKPVVDDEIWSRPPFWKGRD